MYKCREVCSVLYMCSRCLDWDRAMCQITRKNLKSLRWILSSAHHPSEGTVLKGPIQLFRLMHYWSDTAFGAYCSTGLGYTCTQYPGLYHSQMEQWTDITCIGVCITQRARIHTARTIGGQVSSLLDYRASSQFTFSVKALFPGCTGSTPSQVTF